MEIILLEKIRNLGDLGDSVTVANGYARNFLIPQKKAMRATDEAKAEVEERRRHLAAQEGKRMESAQARADLLPRGVQIARLAQEGGKLYGSVSTADIAEALSSDSARVEKSEVALPDGPIKMLGKFPVEVTLHPEVRFTVLINVTAEDSAGADGVAENAAEMDADGADGDNDKSAATDGISAEIPVETSVETPAETSPEHPDENPPAPEQKT